MKKNLIKITIFACIFILTGILFVGCSYNVKGAFCNLQNAYDNGWIVKEDIQKIAEYHNNSTYTELTITEKDSEIIKKAYVNQFYRESVVYKDITYKDITIVEFLGEYNDCFAVIIKYRLADPTAEVWQENIAGVDIHYNNGLRIYICKIF